MYHFTTALLEKKDISRKKLVNERDCMRLVSHLFYCIIGSSKNDKNQKNRSFTSTCGSALKCAEHFALYWLQLCWLNLAMFLVKNWTPPVTFVFTIYLNLEIPRQKLNWYSHSQKNFSSTHGKFIGSSDAGIIPWIDEYPFFFSSPLQQVRYPSIEENWEKRKVADSFESAISPSRASTLAL